MDGPVDPVARYTDLIVFYVGGLCLGIDIRVVQEIHRATQITRVPLAPPYILGVLNLRGQIVTIVDPGALLGVSRERKGDRLFHLIVFHRSESIGLWVDRMGDVVQVPDGMVEKNPANIGGVSSRYLTGIVQRDRELVSMVDLNELLRIV
jgi:purine-binding chemotaxis protein CheW